MGEREGGSKAVYAQILGSLELYLHGVTNVNIFVFLKKSFEDVWCLQIGDFEKVAAFLIKQKIELDDTKEFFLSQNMWKQNQNKQTNIQNIFKVKKNLLEIRELFRY